MWRSEVLGRRLIEGELPTREQYLLHKARWSETLDRLEQLLADATAPD